MKVRLMIGGLSKCRAVSPANRAKSERSHAEWRHKSRYGRAVATGQPAETSGVDLPQARRLAETEVAELRSEGDKMVGDDIAEEGIRHLQAINFKDRPVGAISIAAE